jgi:hypothetical protein
MNHTEKSRYVRVTFDTQKNCLSPALEKNLTGCVICGNSDSRVAYHPPSTVSSALPDHVERVALSLCTKHKSALSYAVRSGNFHSIAAFVHEWRLRHVAASDDVLWSLFGEWVASNDVLSMPLAGRADALSAFLDSSPAHKRLEESLKGYLGVEGTLPH